MDKNGSQTELENEMDVVCTTSIKEKVCLAIP